MITIPISARQRRQPPNAPSTNPLNKVSLSPTKPTHSFSTHLPFFSSFLYTINKMFCRSLLTITTLVALYTSGAAAATLAAATAGPAGCVTFDVFWNLLAFGFNGKDYSAGSQDTWSSSSGRKNVPGHLVVYVLTINQFVASATDITTSNRPWVSPSIFFCVADSFLFTQLVFAVHST